jgi:hypothetical protein
VLIQVHLYAIMWNNCPTTTPGSHTTSHSSTTSGSPSHHHFRQPQPPPASIAISSSCYKHLKQPLPPPQTDIQHSKYATTGGWEGDGSQHCSYQFLLLQRTQGNTYHRQSWRNDKQLNGMWPIAGFKFIGCKYFWFMGWLILQIVFHVVAVVPGCGGLTWRVCIN